MPVKSAKQFRLMEGAAKGAGYGPDPKVAKEFLKATPKAAKSKFAKAFTKKTK
jgi:hypothetical protein